MSDIEWGEPIEINGKRPEWLKGKSKLIVKWRSGGVSVPNAWTARGIDSQAKHSDCLTWKNVTSIRLPADHWYYQGKIELTDYDDYQALRDVLNEAFEQAASGKGKDRHANDKAWLTQPIFEIGRMVGIGFNTGQAIKKLQESTRMEPDAAVRELLGAIVYAASAIQLIREGGE